jgi:ubiquinone/menaquinone biosynthesis C-methylase UbiE
MSTTTLSPDDLAAVKGRQQATWAAGDYAVIGTTLQLVGETLCEAVDVQAGWRVLDVAAGNGNAALAAARRGCEVTATDYVGSLLDRTVRRADGEGLALTTQEADAEALPFADESFDAVLSTFGVMFTPNPPQSGAELVRVCARGGRIGLANWTPEGFIGKMFKIVGAHVPPPAGVPSPLLWGTEDHLRSVLGGTDVAVTRKHFTFRYRSAEHWFETFRDYYGPTVRAWAALDEAGRASFQSQLVALAAGASRTAGSLAVDSEYLEVVATKR